MMKLPKFTKFSVKKELIRFNTDTLNLIQTHEPGLETRVEIFTQADAFFTVKDQKANFPAKVPIRLLNPAKPQLGKITKCKLQRMNSELWHLTKLNQCQCTNDAISWFNGLKDKKRRHFLIFDVVKFYPSISESILKKSFAWARTLINIPKSDEDQIFMARQSFLFMNQTPWVKKDNSTFDVTMGSYDGAEVAEFVGLFLLNELSQIMSISDFAFYRDDGICALKGTRRAVDGVRKKIEKNFKKVGLQVETPKNGPSKSVDFLDLNLNLITGFHAPYRKPLSEPLFVHTDSNHPPSIRKNLPLNICKRLSANSSNAQIFDIAAKPLIVALKRDGYDDFEMKYIPKETKPKVKKSNSKKVIYCNLPWNMAVRNKIGKEFLSLVDAFKNSLQAKYLNKHTIKLSYSTMRNLGSHIAVSNRKKLNSNPAKIEEPKCKCETDREIIQCPVNGQCMTKNVVYSAEVKYRPGAKYCDTCLLEKTHIALADGGPW